MSDLRAVSSDIPLQLTPAEKLELFNAEVTKERERVTQEHLEISKLTDNVTYRACIPPEKAQRFLLLIAQGLPTRLAAKESDIHPPTLIYYWITHDPTFAARYMAAKQAKCLAYMEEIEAISDAPKHSMVDVADARLRVDTRKWLLSKVIPKIFGDKLEVNQNVNGPPQVNIILPGKGGGGADLPPASSATPATITTHPIVIDGQTTPVKISHE